MKKFFAKAKDAVTYLYLGDDPECGFIWGLTIATAIMIICALTESI